MLLSKTGMVNSDNKSRQHIKMERIDLMSHNSIVSGFIELLCNEAVQKEMSENDFRKKLIERFPKISAYALNKAIKRYKKDTEALYSPYPSDKVRQNQRVRKRIALDRIALAE